MLRSDFRSQQYVERTKPDYTELGLTIPGRSIVAGAGELYVAQPKVVELYPSADILAQRYWELFVSHHNLRTSLHRLDNELRKFLNADPASVVFLDIETTGFSNTPLFLIGLLYFDDGNLIIEQLFARDYSEEPNLLHYFCEFASKVNILVTFNGKSFDVPFIKDRMIYHGKYHLKWTQTHVDILHHSRRRWRGRIPDCKLQTLESYICGRQRVGDIPSAVVPEVYRDFVRNGNTQFLADVFHHNALDLITLLELTIILLS